MNASFTTPPPTPKSGSPDEKPSVLDVAATAIPGTPDDEERHTNANSEANSEATPWNGFVPQNNVGVLPSDMTRHEARRLANRVCGEVKRTDFSHARPHVPCRAPLSQVRPHGPQPGDVLLFSHARGLTRLVPWWTRSRYYHTAIYEGGPFVLEARPSGVIRRDIAHERGNVFRIIPMPTERAAPAIEFARSCLGARYDVLSVALLVLWQTFPKFPAITPNDCRFTCNELVLYAWLHAGIDLFPGREPQFTVPGDLARLLPPDARDQCLYPPISDGPDAWT